jgi:hypothetical protein
MIDAENSSGIDLTQIITNDLVLQDRGLVLRQHQPNISAVAIEDIYGMISTSAARN